MGIEHPEPTAATIKELYGNAYCCAHPQCTRPLYKVDSETGQRILNSRVAHICSRREGGQRWNKDQTAEENRSGDNLLLLCIEHSYEIDDRDRAERFAVDMLLEWKKQQLAEFDSLSLQEAKEAASASFHPSSIEMNNSVVTLGGQGGNAPGAAGGGGGAIGNGSRGGEGGPGGKVINYGFIDLKGRSGQAPGAGGGGWGAFSENAVGGEGGGGGDCVTGWFRAEDLPDTIEIVVGRGGLGGENDGDGEDGGETRFGDLLTAKGGKGGRCGTRHAEAREVVTTDLEKGLRVSSLHLAYCIYPHHGFLDLLSAHWEYWELENLPSAIQWALVCTVSMGNLAENTALEMATVLSDPNGSRIFKQTFTVSNGGDDRRKVAMEHHVTTLRFTASVAGVWTITIVSGGIELARLPIEIRIGKQQL